jgi:hypothetical protein
VMAIQVQKYLGHWTDTTNTELLYRKFYLKQLS